MNAFQKWFERKNVTLEHINMGGGLAIDYEKPLENPISPLKPILRPSIAIWK